ncbi:MAG: hypothetical protein CMK59_00210 [Proteobacteria bacterium]|nr:hypothetical protein [Pseudomonadota bacterium]
MVVGDDDQSIYGFRGADVHNIFRFQDDFKPVKVVRLEQNYRSDGNILLAANAVIENNPKRMEKKMWTESKEGALLELSRSKNLWEEATSIQTRIEEFIRQGYSHDQMAIIYRTNASSLPFEQVFRQSSIPHTLVGARKFYDRAEIRDLMSYLRLIVNPSDEIAFKRAIAAPKRGIGPKTIDQIATIARLERINILLAARQWSTGSREIIKSSKPKTKIKSAALKFCELVEDLRLKWLSGATAHELMRHLIEESGYQATLEAEALKEKGKNRHALFRNMEKSDAERRLDNIRTFFEDMLRFYADFDPASFQTQLELLRSEDVGSLEEDLNSEELKSEEFKSEEALNVSKHLHKEPYEEQTNADAHLGSLFAHTAKVLQSQKVIGSEESTSNVLNKTKQEKQSADPLGALWLGAFLDGAALSSPTEDIPDSDKGSVTLMTGHLAKGLEFPIVFLVGLNEGVFPHFRSLEREEDVAEERRLFYVAMTRAMKHLVLSYSLTSERWDGNNKRETALQPSRFLIEIPNQLMDAPLRQATDYNNAERRLRRMERLGVKVRSSGSSGFGNQPRKNSFRAQGSRGSSGKEGSLGPIPKNIEGLDLSAHKRSLRAKLKNLSSESMFSNEGVSGESSFPDGESYMTKQPDSVSEFQEGIYVLHEKFGHGIIVRTKGSSNNPKLEVEFQQWGKRTLIARMANLEIVIR